jgi:hypothetical protein
MVLAYRFGFLCHQAEDPPFPSKAWTSVSRAWPSRICEGFRLWLHPQARIETYSRPEGSVVIIGDAYTQSGRNLIDLVATTPWDDPWPALDDLGGRHAVLFLSGTEMRVAHDAFGSRSLFYSPGHKAVASHARLLARAYDLPISRESAAFMDRPEYKARTVGYLPGDITAYENVYALVPNNYWDGERTHRYWPRIARAEIGKEAFLSEVRRYFDGFVPFISERYTPIFGLTGGIDSRAALAAFGNKFLGTTWTHYYPKPERPIVQALLEYLAVDHKFMRRGDYPRGRIAMAAEKSSGELRTTQLLSEAMAAAYPGPNHVFIRGYGGEILRGFLSYQKRILDLSPRSMTTAYGSSIRKCPSSDDYIAFCDKAFTVFRDRANYNGLEAFGYKPVDHFYWEHRMGMWGASMLNGMDPGVYSMVGFNSRPLFEAAFSLPDNVRRMDNLKLSKALLKSVVRLYDEELADIPYV